MNDFNYDIAVRTTGKGGEKYRKLLNSIQKLYPQPKQVFVILPEGAEPPIERIGTENFIFAPKGMMTQRIEAINNGMSEYILFCDDDICFACDFVEKLHFAIQCNDYDFVVGEVLEFLPARNGIKFLIPIICAGAYPALFRKDRFVTVLKSTGWIYNRYVPKKDVVLPTQSAAGCMLFSKRSVFKKLDFEDELWAQHDGMAPMEDQIMFYKAFLRGMKIGVVTDAHYDHLDARNSRATSEKELEKKYWAFFNRYVFWYRFIYCMQMNMIGKIMSVIAFQYYIIMNKLFLLLGILLKRKDKRFFKLVQKGLAAGKKFVRSDDYTKIPTLIKKN